MEDSSDSFPVASACASRRKPFASWVVFDTEATGLKRRPRITELCMFAVLTDELKSTSRPIPRVINKLQLCFNPESVIQPEASRLTGLFNDVLEQMATFRDQASLISGFLASLPQPVCIIAHNGHRFDFTLLHSEFRKANHSLPAEAEVYCADSLEAFRILDGLPAVPEWVVQREREEKQRNALSCNTTISSAQNVNSNEAGSSAVVATNTASDHPQDTDRSSAEESRTLSPTKRCIDNSSDDSASVSKLSKTETVPTFGSQLSVTDSDLADAYDAAIAQAEAEEDDGGHVSPVPALVDSSLQAVHETTPVKDPSWINTDPLPGPVVKKPPPSSVSLPQAARVVRRLFGEEPGSSKVESFQGALKNDSFQKNARDIGHTGESGVMPSSQGGLPDEKIVQVVEQGALASLPPSQSGAGEPVLLSQDKGAMSVSIRQAGDPQPSSLQDQAEERRGKTANTPINKSKMPTETGLDLSKSSRQNQVSEVTSSSSSAGAIRADGKASPIPKAAPSSGAAPKLSYKLEEVYRRQFGKYPDMAHTAEDDCRSLLTIIVSKRSEFVTFVEDHAVRFDSVEPMY